MEIFRSFPNVKSIDLDFQGAWSSLKSFCNLQNVKLNIQDGYYNHFLRALGVILVYSGSTLQRLQIKAKPRTSYRSWPSGLRQHHSWTLLERCTKLQHIDLPFSKEFWSAISRLATLKSVGTHFDHVSTGLKNESFPVLQSQDLDELLFRGKKDLVSSQIY